MEEWWEKKYNIKNHGKAEENPTITVKSLNHVSSLPAYLPASKRSERASFGRNPVTITLPKEQRR